MFLTQVIGGSEGGVPGARPPMGPNSFIFAHIFTEKCPRQRSTPPQWVHGPPYGTSWIRHCMFFLLYRTTDSWPAELRQDHDITKVKPMGMSRKENESKWPTSFITQLKTLTHRNFIKSAKGTFNKVQIASVSNFVILTSL